MIVVSDTSAITTLLQIGRSEILERLFGEVLIPDAVERELLRFHSRIPEFIRVQSVRDATGVEVLSEALHAGEAEAIVLAGEVRAEYLLVDEKRARATAEARGLKVIGLLGVLLLARKSGHIESLAAVIRDIESRAGFFVAPAVAEAILRAAGEL